MTNRLMSYISNAVGWRPICQQNANDIQMTLLSCLMQRRVTMLQFTIINHRINKNDNNNQAVVNSGPRPRCAPNEEYLLVFIF